MEMIANCEPNKGEEVDNGHSGSTKQEQGAIKRVVQSRGGGLQHVEIKASDINATLSAMASAGLPMIDTRGRPGSRRALIGFPHAKATAGSLLHLVQRDA